MKLLRVSSSFRLLCRKCLQTLRSKCGPAFFILLALKILFSIFGYFVLKHWPIIPVTVVDFLNLPSTLYMGNVTCHQCNNYSTHILMEPRHLDCNSSEVILVNIVTSSFDERERRNWIRKTWGSVKEYERFKIRTFFVVGGWMSENAIEKDNVEYLTTTAEKSNRTSSRSQITAGNKTTTYNNIRNSSVSIDSATLQRVSDEMEEFNDIIVVNMKENFRVSTNLTMAALRWVTERCREATYIMKTDVTSFNMISRFVDYLKPITTQNLIAGLCTTGEYPDRRSASPYYVSEDTYPGSIYPLHAKGRTYILSIPAAVQVLSVSSELKPLPLEEIFVTGLSRAVAGVVCSSIPVLIPRDTGNLSDCDIASWVGNVPNVRNTDDMERLWSVSNNKSLVENCKRINQYNEYKDVYVEKSVWMIVVILIILKVVIGLLMCVLCRAAKRCRCKERCNSARGYVKVSDDEKFQIDVE